MGMQNFIKIYQKVQKIWPVSFYSFFFQNLNLGKTSKIPNVILQSHWLHLVNINVYAKFHHNIVHSSRDRAIFTFSEFGARLIKNVSSQSLGLDLVNINVYATVYQNIPLSLRDRPFSLFQNLALTKPRPTINFILQFLGLDLFNIFQTV